MFTLEELEEMGVPIFESADELKKEKCGDENEFETVYVKADSSFYMCDNGKWDNDFSGDISFISKNSGMLAYPGNFNMGLAIRCIKK